MARVVPRPTGLNQHTAPPRRGAITAVFEVTQMRALLRGLQSEARVANAAIRAAHEDLASTLQSYMAQELREGIQDPNGRHGNPMRAQSGRSGDDAHSAGTLIRAIESVENRDVKITGFSVGFLEKTRAASYWRVQEFGYGGFVNTIVPGLFLSTNDKLRFPVEDISQHTDPRLIQFHVDPADHPGTRIVATGVLIKNPIRGYHYMEQGWERFRDAGFLGTEATEIYKAAFAGSGAPFLAQYLTATGKHFRASSIRSVAPSNRLSGYGVE